MDASTNTIKSMRYLCQEFGDFIQQNETDTVLDNLIALPSANIELIIAEHPENWLTNGEKNWIIPWWNSPNRLDRINRIKEDIVNGTYL